MKKKSSDYHSACFGFVESVLSGEKIAGKEIIEACQRFVDDLENPAFEFRERDANFVCAIIERTMCHKQGEDLEGRPLKGTPFLLQPWQVFAVYNICGFFKAGTDERRFKETFIFLPRKSGKALSLDTEIPTPTGWKTIGEIRTGDTVFGQDGKPSKVVAESEIFMKPMFDVVFEDGASIKASADHIWTVQTKESRRTSRRPVKREKSAKLFLRESAGWFDTTTVEMFESFKKERADGKGTEYTYRVPMPIPVEYGEKNLPIDPYTLGVWLGDGTSTASTLTCAEKDIPEMVSNLESLGHSIKIHRHKNRAPTLSIDVVGCFKKNPFFSGLRELGVLGNKHIPDAYMFGSVEQRLEMLRGLMDTDGCCGKSGECEFSQKDERFADQVVELLSSLGIKAKKRKKQVRCNGKICTAYSVFFFTDKERSCFRLTRKHERLKDKLSPRMGAKSIVDIRPVEAVPSKCIAIDNASHLYLAGRNYTSTHNTSTVAALAYGLALLSRKSGSTVYLIAATAKQAYQSFEFIKNSLEASGAISEFKVRDSYVEHSMSCDMGSAGYIKIEALASNPKGHDSFNAPICIADELHAIDGAEYNRFKEAQKAYTNKLMIGISTAGDNPNSFCYRRLQYSKKVVSGEIRDDTLFVLIAKADEDEDGNVDFTNPIQHEKANPSYGVTIRPDDILQDALQAQNDPQQRKDFLSRSLNVYTSAVRAYFNMDEFEASDSKYSWTLEELAKLPIDWYGGADLSKMHDLTATALYGSYQGVDITITHAFFPRVMAHLKADEDNIPLFGWADDGLLTLCNSPTVNYSDVVNWFVDMRKKGFKIKRVGFDKKFGREFFTGMKTAGFSIEDAPQYYWRKSEGFRHIEKMAKDGNFYFLHSDAFRYCASNVAAVEKTDDMVQYEKVNYTQRIDIFDACVFSCCKMLEDDERERKASSWWS